MLDYWRFLLRKSVKNEKGVTMIEYVFVVAAVIAMGVALFTSNNEGTLGQVLKGKLDGSVQKIK